MTREYDMKPCIVPDCPGTMTYSLRVVPVKGEGREVEQPRPGWLCDVDQGHIVREAPGDESFLTDPLERRLLAAFRALPNQKARWSVVKVVEGWLELERDGLIAPDKTRETS